MSALYSGRKSPTKRSLTACFALRIISESPCNVSVSAGEETMQANSFLRSSDKGTRPGRKFDPNDLPAFGDPLEASHRPGVVEDEFGARRDRGETGVLLPDVLQPHVHEHARSQLRRRRRFLAPNRRQEATRSTSRPLSTSNACDAPPTQVTLPCARGKTVHRFCAASHFRSSGSLKAGVQELWSTPGYSV